MPNHQFHNSWTFHFVLLSWSHSKNCTQSKVAKKKLCTWKNTTTNSQLWQHHVCPIVHKAKPQPALLVASACIVTLTTIIIISNGIISILDTPSVFAYISPAPKPLLLYIHVLQLIHDILTILQQSHHTFKVPSTHSSVILGQQEPHTDTPHPVQTTQAHIDRFIFISVLASPELHDIDATIEARRMRCLQKQQCSQRIGEAM